MSYRKGANFERECLPVNRIIRGDCRTISANFPKNSIDMVIFSPPYRGKRDYGEETVTIWDGDPNCEHDWSEAIKPTGFLPLLLPSIT